MYACKVVTDQLDKYRAESLREDAEYRQRILAASRKAVKQSEIPKGIKPINLNFDEDDSTTSA